MGDNAGKIVKVNDPIVRILMTIATSVAIWCMTQVQHHSESLASHSEALVSIVRQVQHLEASLVSIESRSEKTTDKLHSDIRDIRTLIERKQ